MAVKRIGVQITYLPPECDVGVGLARLVVAQEDRDGLPNVTPISAPVTARTGSQETGMTGRIRVRDTCQEPCYFAIKTRTTSSGVTSAGTRGEALPEYGLVA